MISINRETEKAAISTAVQISNGQNSAVQPGGTAEVLYAFKDGRLHLHGKEEKASHGAVLKIEDNGNTLVCDRCPDGSPGRFEKIGSEKLSES